MERRKLTISKKWRIIGATQDAGQSMRMVAAANNLHVSVVSRLIQKVQQTGDVADRPRSGRPKALRNEQIDFLADQVHQQPQANSAALKERLINVYGINVSRSTITLSLRSRGFHNRRAARKPELTNNHKITRYQFADAHKNWNLDSWKRVIWTDEATFRLRVAADGRVRVWRQDADNRYAERFVVPTVHKGGPSLMVWGAISWNHKSSLEFLDSMTADVYLHQVLQPVGLPFARTEVPEHLIWMDDNAPPHRAQVVQEYLQAEGVERLQWPAISPDLNPIEKMWDLLRTAVARRHPLPAKLDDLRVALAQEWDSIPMQTVQSLIRSMTRRCQAVLVAQGGPTKY
jgi:transposase